MEVVRDPGSRFEGEVVKGSAKMKSLMKHIKEVIGLFMKHEGKTQDAAERCFDFVFMIYDVRLLIEKMKHKVLKLEPSLSNAEQFSIKLVHESVLMMSEDGCEEESDDCGEEKEESEEELDLDDYRKKLRLELTKIGEKRCLEDLMLSEVLDEVLINFVELL